MSDVDTISPKTKTVTIGGKTINVLPVTARTTLDIFRIQDEVDKKIISEYVGLDQMVTLLTGILQKSDPSVTRDWLLDYTTFGELISLGSNKTDSTAENKAGEPVKN